MSEKIPPVNISIGQVGLSLHIAEEHLQQYAAKRYQEFAAESTESLLVYLRSEDSSRHPHGEFSYHLDDASLELHSTGADFHGVRHEYALDSLLRILLTAVLLPRHGFLLHAASVVRNGRAYIFAGRSGAGKSTVASLSPAGTVLTDEISLLRYSDGCWQAYGTPFWGEFRAAGMNRRYPIAGIYFLTQDRQDRFEPLSAKEILRALLPCVLFFTSEKRANEALLSTLLEIVERVPGYRLHFRRSPDFWSVIAA
ncbi:MAG: hypothetical protein ACRD5M_13825 [Candidatus Acidiferrales bacterium]